MILRLHHCSGLLYHSMNVEILYKTFINTKDLYCFSVYVDSYDTNSGCKY